jgi:hypothetical protein
MTDPTLAARVAAAQALADGITPGPWEAGVQGNGTPGYVYCDNELGSAVAITYGDALPFQVFSPKQLAANTALIAAAPDLVTLVSDLAAALAAAGAREARLVERERKLALLFKVTDGGQYMADWESRAATLLALEADHA